MFSLTLRLPVVVPVVPVRRVVVGPPRPRLPGTLVRFGLGVVAPVGARGALEIHQTCLYPSLQLQMF